MWFSRNVIRIYRNISRNINHLNMIEKKIVIIIFELPISGISYSAKYHYVI